MFLTFVQLSFIDKDDVIIKTQMNILTYLEDMQRKNFQTLF